MRSFHNHFFQVGASYLSMGVLAVGSLTAGQSTFPGQTQASNQQTASSGGWKRVGSSVDQSTPANSQDAYLPPQSGNNNEQNQPVDQDPMPPPGAVPNGQAGYNAGPYAQPPNSQPPSSQAPYGPAQPAYGQPQPNYGQGQPSYGPVQQPQAPVPSQLSVPAGTFITVRVNQFLSSDQNQQGDAFSASLIQPLVVNGVVIAEPGQTIGGRVVESQKAGRVEGTSRLRVQLTELTLVDGQQIPVQTQLIDRKGNTSVGRDVAGVAGTTGLGAAIGAAAGWGTGAAIGAGAGAAVGVLGVLLTRGQPTVIAPEQALTFRLEAPVTVYTDRAPQAFRYVQPNEYDRASYNQSPYPVAGPQYAAAPYSAPYPYYGGYAYGYPYYSPFYYGPSFSLFFGSRYYGRPYYYGRPGFYGRFSYGRGGRR